MSGSLFHAREFRVDHYTGNDGQPHHEVVPVDGDAEIISYSSWNELKVYCELHGVPPEVWPEFDGDHAHGIDVPLDEVAAMQGPFRAAIARLPPEVVGGNRRLAQIASFLQRGEQVFFC
ncbi:hypothetical protein [Sorangium sp. So ce385]|uniref:hypothetical protein n=1 Tax=Sorangium sp. So ce385 TaxID=3133308 RepID=UPI003F5B1D99